MPGSTAARLPNDIREKHYVKQNGGRPLTPAQRRRIKHKVAREAPVATA